MSAYRWGFAALAAVLLLISVCAVVNAQSAPGGVVKIDSPSKNGGAGPTEPVRGRAQLSKGYSLWIVPYDPAAGKYYPQQSPVPVRSDGTWSTHLAVDNVFRVNKTFQIHAVVADSSASRALSVDAASQTGIGKLPPGAQAVDTVTVTRVVADTVGPSSASRSATGSAASAAAPSSNGVTNSSATNFPEVSAAARSKLLPGFEALYALVILAAISVMLRLKRQR